MARLAASNKGGYELSLVPKRDCGHASGEAEDLTFREVRAYYQAAGQCATGTRDYFSGTVSKDVSDLAVIDAATACPLSLPSPGNRGSCRCESQRRLPHQP